MIGSVSQPEDPGCAIPGVKERLAVAVVRVSRKKQSHGILRSDQDKRRHAATETMNWLIWMSY